jgi:hypothetical protein
MRVFKFIRISDMPIDGWGKAERAQIQDLSLFESDNARNLLTDI